MFSVPPKNKHIPFEAFKIYKKELTVLGSFTSVRNSYQAVDLIRSGKVKVNEYISHKLHIGDFVRGCELIEKGLENVKKVVLYPKL